MGKTQLKIPLPTQENWFKFVATAQKHLREVEVNMDRVVNIKRENGHLVVTLE